MSIGRQAELVIGATLLVVVLFFGGRYVYMKWNTERLESKNDVLTSDAAADKVYVREYKTVVEQRETKDAQVERALQRNRSWADEPLPDDVADLLRDPAESAP